MSVVGKLVRAPGEAETEAEAEAEAEEAEAEGDFGKRRSRRRQGHKRPMSSCAGSDENQL
jgi:hypothetical protein